MKNYYEKYLKYKLKYNKLKGGSLENVYLSKYSEFFDRYTKNAMDDCIKTAHDKVQNLKQRSLYLFYHIDELILLYNILNIAKGVRPAYIFPSRIEINLTESEINETIEKVKLRLPENIECRQINILMFNENTRHYIMSPVYLIAQLENIDRFEAALTKVYDKITHYERIMGSILGFPEDASPTGKHEFAIRLTNPFGGVNKGAVPDYLIVAGFRYDNWLASYEQLNKSYHDLFENKELVNEILGPPVRITWNIQTIRDEQIDDENRQIFFDDGDGWWA